MSATQHTPIAAGQFGDDNGHEFRVIDERRCEVQIEYLESGDQAWFARNRFERDGDSMVLR